MEAQNKGHIINIASVLSHITGITYNKYIQLKSQVLIYLVNGVYMDFMKVYEWST